MARSIGRTGVNVNPIGLGAWQLSNYAKPSDTAGVALIKAAVELGVELIDTADCYCTDDSNFGHNETIVRQGLQAAGHNDIKVATKVGFRRPKGVWQPDARPERIKSCCDESLQRLGTDSLFLYQLHTPDPKVPIEETVGAMAQLQAAGKIEHIGLSNVDQRQLERGLSTARIETVQNECNPWCARDVDSGLVGFCAQQGISYLPYHPVGGKEQHTALSTKSVLADLAARYEVSTYCVLLSWLLTMNDNVIPIPGATRLASIEDSQKATTFKMDSRDWTTLAAAAQ